MVDPVKETFEFQKEYGCSRRQARMAALLSKELYENQSPEIIALDTVLRNRGFNPYTTAVLSLKISALAIWKFTQYGSVKQSAKKYAYKNDKNIPNLATDIYPLTSMVLGLHKDTIPVKLRAFALRYEGGKYTPKQLIFSVLDETMKKNK